MKYRFLFILLSQTLYSFGQHQPEMNVIYGDHHIFTIETPEGWMNDKNAASKIGLVSLFFSKTDSDKVQRSHMYAHGYDKLDNNSDLSAFVNGDVTSFKKKYPALTFERIEVSKSGAIVNATMISYGSLEDRYKEEVIYLETEFSILVFVFSAFSDTDYQKYQSVFDQFVASFTYRGNNPEPFLKWQEGQN